jgi:glycosyltransferase involved in cell wall biosynthesis
MTTPPRVPKLLSIVMPAFNEEASIRAVVEEHVHAARQLPPGISWEIVVVDDASLDKTPHILADMQKDVTQLVVERHAVNQGIYRSFFDGYHRSRGDFIYATGSDGQWPAENLLKMYAELSRGADLIVGVRTNRRDVYTPTRRAISYFFNTLSTVLFGVPVKDAGSIKLGARPIFTADLVSRSVFAEAERIVYAQRTGYKVVFVPIVFLPRSGGKATGASWRNIRTASLDLFRAWLRYTFKGTQPSHAE